MSVKNRKVLVIGLDGATWDLLEPWAKENKLPTFRWLMENGVWGELESTIPPVTCPAWACLATGRNPGKIGMFDFLSRKDNRYKLHSATSKDFQGDAFWDYIAGDRRRVGVVNYPMLFPPYAINGFMISNMAFSGTTDIAFPKSLKGKLNEVCGGYENSVDYHNKKYDDVKLFLEDLNRVLDKQIAALHYLLKQEWELFVYVLSATDWIQHLMWKHIDKAHPLYEVQSSKQYKEEFIKFWRRVDDFLREIIEINKETNILIVSDHGFGPQDECFNLGKWLELKGYLVRETERGNRIYTSMKKLVMSVLGPIGKTKLREIIPDKFVREVRGRVTVDITDQIDFNRSKAYVLGHTIPFGAIYINKEGRDLQGCVGDEDYEALKLEIMYKLKNLKDDIEKDVEVEIFNPKDIYRGMFVDRAPDIIFTIDNWRCIVNEERFDDVLFKNEPYSNRHTGSHRMNGIFVAYGPDIKQGGKVQDAKIYDIAPTILHMFNIPMPRDMDGRVLKMIFKEDSEQVKRNIVYQEVREKERAKEKIKQLKDMGKI